MQLGQDENLITAPGFSLMTDPPPHNTPSPTPSLPRGLGTFPTPPPVQAKTSCVSATFPVSLSLYKYFSSQWNGPQIKRPLS